MHFSNKFGATGTDTDAMILWLLRNNLNPQHLNIHLDIICIRSTWKTKCIIWIESVLNEVEIIMMKIQTAVEVF